MVALSLMPPVDYCASCEGKKAESKARDVATAREAEAFAAAFEAPGGNPKAQPALGALPPVAADDTKVIPVDTIARPLLSPELRVQASLAKAANSPLDESSSPGLRLQAFQAYGSSPGARPGS